MVMPTQSKQQVSVILKKWVGAGNNVKPVVYPTAQEKRMRQNMRILWKLFEEALVLFKQNSCPSVFPRFQKACS
jgi:hypothetical protein